MVGKRSHLNPSPRNAQPRPGRRRGLAFPRKLPSRSEASSPDSSDCDNLDGDQTRPDENRDSETRILKRVQALGCDGLLIVPVGAPSEYATGELRSAPPKVLLGRAIEGEPVDAVVIDNVSAGRQATDYLLDLGHRRIGSITGRLSISTGRGRLDGMIEAMLVRGCPPLERDIRSGEFREEVAYSAALDLLRGTDRPTALYVANGVMALGVMRALADLGLRCPQDISIASTDTILCQSWQSTSVR